MSEVKFRNVKLYNTIKLVVVILGALELIKLFDIDEVQQVIYKMQIQRVNSDT